MRIISGEARGRKIRAPPGRGVRPPLDSMREALFNILGDLVEGSSVLDLFAGAGAFGLEAVSRGARLATFVERDPAALHVLERNIEDLGFSGRCRIIRGDALYQPPHRRPKEVKSVEPVSKPILGEFDIIFLDPPFHWFKHEEKTSVLVERVEGLLERLLLPGGMLLLRHPAASLVKLRRPPADVRTYGKSTVLLIDKA